MSLRLGSAVINGLKVGGITPGKVMLGDVQVWPAVGSTPPEPRPWTPADLNLVYWFDASQGGTISLNGPGISQWDSAVGGGAVAIQGAANSQPNLREESTPPYARMVVADTQFMTLQGLPVIQGGDMFVMAIGGPCPALIAGDNGALAIRSLNSEFADYGQSQRSQTFIALTTTDSSVYVMEVDASGTGSVLTAMNGDTAGGSHDAFALQTILFRTEQGPGSGSVFQFFLARGPFDPGDRERVQGYLAHKLGRTVQLPADHPYKDAPPMAGVPPEPEPELWTPADLPGTVAIYDFTNAAAVTLNGSAVSRVEPVSGPALVQNNAASQPAWTPAADGIPNGVFAAAVRRMESEARILVNAGFISALWVYSNVSLEMPNGGGIFLGCVDTSNPGSGRGPEVFGVLMFETQRPNRQTSGWVDGSMQTHFYTAPPTHHVHVHGPAAIVDPANGASVFAFSNRWSGGENWDLSSRPDATLYQLVVQADNVPLSDADRQRFEGWAAWNPGHEGLGLVAKLPADHPYKNAPPTK